MHWKPLWVALLVAALVIAGEQTVERFQRAALREHERTHAIAELARLRARLEGLVNGNLLAIQGLGAVIAAQPDIDQQVFARIARGLVTENSSLRHIAGAPGMVISLMYPLAGNEAALGLDYRSHADQRMAAMRAVESGGPVVAGPLPLVQGGNGLVMREPVFLPDREAGQPPRLWGLVSAVIDIDRLYELAGLPAAGTGTDMEVAIRGKDGTGAQGDSFFGDEALFDRDPVTATISLPGGSWQIAAAPTTGWGQGQNAHGRELSLIRIGGFGLALILSGMAYQLTRRNEAMRRTSAQLSESQALFQGFLDQLPAGAFVRDARRGTTLFENRWLKRHLPRSHGTCGAENEHDEDALTSGTQLLQSRAQNGTGEPMVYETLRFVLPDGGTAPRIGGVVMDVTARVLSEERLAANRAELRTLLDTIPDLVWMKDPDGIYLACNRRFEAFLGASEREIVGRRDHDFVPAELADFFRERDMAAIAVGGPSINEETVTFASDGHQELLETIKSPVHDADGRLIGVLGIARDITQRRRAEDKLRATTERLQYAESIAHIGHWEYRVADGRILWSDETYRIFGLEPQQRTIDDAWLRSRVHPEDRDRHDGYLKTLLDARPGTQIPEFRYRMQTLNGDGRVVSIWVRIEYSDDGGPTRFFGTVQDVTERERMQEDLRARVAELTRWQGVMLGREDRIQELKREVNELLAARGQSLRYLSQEETG